MIPSLIGWSPALIWFLVGVAFLLSEMMLPGFVLLFFGLGSWVTALLLLFVRPELGLQLLFFVAASLLALFTLRRNIVALRGQRHRGRFETNAFVGKRGMVTREITADRVGEIKALGSFWQASATTDIKKGVEITIVGQDENNPLLLHVAPRD